MVSMRNKKKVSFNYHQILLLSYFFAYKTVSFPSKTIKKSRSVLLDGSRSLGLFRKGKTRITAKLHRTDLIICTHSREGKPLLIAE